jgi:predicted heme/steroid binding protein
MADTKLSALTEATEVGADDFLYIVQGSDSRKVTKSTLLSDPYSVASAFSWDSATSSPAASTSRALPPAVLENLHNQMKGCVLNTDGTVNYYLSSTDWSQKAGGGASVLTGADGNVMVEIPKFYYRSTRSGSIYTWEISHVELPGFVVHPAFVKNGTEVAKRYYSAYDACVYDVSGTTYLSGLNHDNNDGANGVGVDVTASTGDKLASVKGIYPMVGLTRAEFRTVAANVGSGWRQLDFALWSAVQMLYLAEHQSFFSQNILGAGNTNGSYLASSADQDDSPHTIAGAGDSIANASTDTTSGAGVNAKPGTSFMKYRGIENFYGNAFNWADGINVNVTANGNVHVTNDSSDWADNTSTNYDLISSGLPTASGFIRDLLPAEGYFLSASNTGASSTTYITDQHFAATGARVVGVGGNANFGAGAGAFAVVSLFASSVRERTFGGRLCL